MVAVAAAGPGLVMLIPGRGSRPVTARNIGSRTAEFDTAEKTTTTAALTGRATAALSDTIGVSV